MSIIKCHIHISKNLCDTSSNLEQINKGINSGLLAVINHVINPVKTLNIALTVSETELLKLAIKLLNGLCCPS